MTGSFCSNIHQSLNPANEKYEWCIFLLMNKIYIIIPLFHSHSVSVFPFACVSQFSNSPFSHSLPVTISLSLSLYYISNTNEWEKSPHTLNLGPWAFCAVCRIASWKRSCGFHSSSGSGSCMLALPVASRHRNTGHSESKSLLIGFWYNESFMINTYIILQTAVSCSEVWVCCILHMQNKWEQNYSFSFKKVLIVI